MSVCPHMRPDEPGHSRKVDIVVQVDALLLTVPRRPQLTIYVRLVPIGSPIRVTGPVRHPAGVKGIGVAEDDHFKIMACAEQLCQEDLHMAVRGLAFALGIDGRLPLLTVGPQTYVGQTHGTQQSTRLGGCAIPAKFTVPVLYVPYHDEF
jgi:hypothetical protein